MMKYIVAVILLSVVLLANGQHSRHQGLKPFSKHGTAACRRGCHWDEKCVCTIWKCHCVPQWFCYTWRDCKYDEKCVSGECKYKWSRSYRKNGK